MSHWGFSFVFMLMFSLQACLWLCSNFSSEIHWGTLFFCMLYSQLDRKKLCFSIDIALRERSINKLLTIRNCCLQFYHAPSWVSNSKQCVRWAHAPHWTHLSNLHFFPPSFFCLLSWRLVVVVPVAAVPLFIPVGDRPVVQDSGIMLKEKEVFTMGSAGHSLDAYNVSGEYSMGDNSWAKGAGDCLLLSNSCAMSCSS